MTFTLDAEVAAILAAAIGQNGPPPALPVGVATAAAPPTVVGLRARPWSHQKRSGRGQIGRHGREEFRRDR
jgi:hypothetical protein